MYTGFNLKNISIPDNPADEKEWRSQFENQKRYIHSTLRDYITNDGIIDGQKIQEEWFPEIKADIFISHSHSDEKLAINLASWLYKKFQLVAFIDSCIWGFSNDLLKQLDNKYCKRGQNDLFDYNKRNYSTSHVHMLLMTALNKMIDKTECVFFLNTENSVLLKGIEDKTLSPWIYGEIEITRIIEKRNPKRIKKYSSGGEVKKAISEESLQVKYDIDLGHFNSLGVNELMLWKKTSATGLDALDKLYALYSQK